MELFLKLIRKKIPTSLNNDKLKKTRSEQFFCNFAVQIAHTVALESKMPENCIMSQYQ